MKLDRCFLCDSAETKIVHKGVRGGDNIDVLQCLGCGLVRLSEVMEDIDLFYSESGMRNKKVASLSELRLETMEDDERRYRFTKKMIFGKKVVDFGCGDGGYLLRARAIAHEVSGVEMERFVRDALRREGINCYEKICDIGIVDVVTMFHVLEHLPNPVNELKEISDHLISGGEIIIEVPNAEDALLSLYDSDKFADFTYWKCHIYLYTMETLKHLAEKVGLRVKFMRQVQRYPLSNHLHWLAKGKSGGHFEWSFLDDAELSRIYGTKLSELGIADTIIASFVK